MDPNSHTIHVPMHQSIGLYGNPLMGSALCAVLLMRAMPLFLPFWSHKLCHNAPCKCVPHWGTKVGGGGLCAMPYGDHCWGIKAWSHGLRPTPLWLCLQEKQVYVWDKAVYMFAASLECAPRNP